jgi:hypothetical protein
MRKCVIVVISYTPLKIAQSVLAQPLQSALAVPLQSVLAQPLSPLRGDEIFGGINNQKMEIKIEIICKSIQNNVI